MSALRGQRLFLVPVGPENEHQRTIDGALPGDVPPNTSASRLLPCWGVTDGNYLVKTQLRAEAGDVFAFIRARSKDKSAYVHRLAVLDCLVRDEAAAKTLYKLQHDYNMGRSTSFVGCCTILLLLGILSYGLRAFCLHRWQTEEQCPFHLDYQACTCCSSVLG